MAKPTDDQIEAWYPRLFRTALRMTGNAADAADATQEAFCKALTAWDRFDGMALPTTWLHRILVNCIRDRFRRQAIQPKIVQDEWALVSAESSSQRSPGPADQDDCLDRLRMAIEDLPAKMRSAFAATVLDGYSYQEAADLLSLPVGTIASRVHAARRRLQGLMQDSLLEDEQ